MHGETLKFEKRKAFFRPYPIKIGTPFDPYEKNASSAFNQIFKLTKRSS
jgi:hypothetical protein